MISASAKKGLSFLRRKPTTSELHLLICFYSQCHFDLSKSFLLLFFSFLNFFPRFQYKTVFFEYLLWLRSSKSCSFLESSSSPRPVPLTSRLVFDLNLFIKVVKWSLRLRAVVANSLQLFKFSVIFCHVAPLSLLPYLLSNIPLLAITLP